MRIKRTPLTRYEIVYRKDERKRVERFVTRLGLRVTFSGPVRLRGKEEACVRAETGATGMLVSTERFWMVAEGEG